VEKMLVARVLFVRGSGLLATGTKSFLSTATAAATTTNTPAASGGVELGEKKRGGSDGLELTERAKERIRVLREQRAKPNLHLRLAVEGGGCSGFSYKFSMFEGEPEKDDLLLGGEPPIVIDTDSLEFVKGSKIDFTEDLIRRSFEVVNNPQVETKCGCGSSFSPKAPK
jgi:iron-sulfur cluster assembly accessory protein